MQVLTAIPRPTPEDTRAAALMPVAYSPAIEQVQRATEEERRRHTPAVPVQHPSTHDEPNGLD